MIKTKSPGLNGQDFVNCLSGSFTEPLFSQDGVMTHRRDGSACRSDEPTSTDRSPARAPKQVLGHHLRKTDYHRGDLVPVVNAIELDRLDMPTFNQFRDDLKQGIRNLCGAVDD